jgi:uncharacterized protein (DUF1330 family)
MTAYAIFIREETLDPAELDAYAAKLGPVKGKFGQSVLAAYGALEVVEGDPAEGVVIIAFPSFEQARRWYYSPEYQEAVKHRFKGARYRGLLVDGLAQDEG